MAKKKGGGGLNIFLLKKGGILEGEAYLGEVP